MQTPLRRGLAAVATSALALGALAITAPAQAAGATDPAPSRSAAAWLVKNLNADGLLESHSEWEGTVYSGPSYGNSVDLAEGLTFVGGQQQAVARIVTAVEKDLDAYLTYGDSYYSGSGAKALALLQSQGRNVTDLTARVEASVITAGASQGRLADQDPTPDEWWADYSNTIGQAYAARALSAVGSDRAADVTDFLLKQQCDAGFFRLSFTADKSSAAQDCDAASPAEPTEQSPDVTALVIIQTTQLAKSDPEVRRARAAAISWLMSQQQADGSFADTNNGVNANTTGLAGWALTAAGEKDAAARAATWLRQLQVVGACAPEKLAGEQGAVAYNEEGWQSGARWGISDLLDRSQWVIADVQALPALASAPAAAAQDAVVLPKFAKAGSTVTATLTGLAAGERACVTGSAGSRDLMGTGKNLSVKISGAKAGTRSVTLKTATGTVTDAVKVLGKKKLTVKAATSAKRGSTTKVTVKGLAAGEKVTVRVKGKKVKVGTAGKKGTFTTRVKVGTKKGAVKVSATGQYSTRTGVKKVAVK